MNSAGSGGIGELLMMAAKLIRGRRFVHPISTARFAVLAVSVLLVGACSSGDGSEDDVTLAPTAVEASDDGEGAVEEDSTSTSTTTATTSTTESSTTSTTLTVDQQAFLEAIELAERLMEPIREHETIRSGCIADPPNCDLDALTANLGADLTEINIDIMEKRIAEREFVVDPLNQIYFFRHDLTGVDPLKAEVVTCELTGAGFYFLDEAGNRVEETAPDVKGTFIKYGLTEQPDGEFLIDLLDVLDQASDPTPEGQLCEEYKD